MLFSPLTAPSPPFIWKGVWAAAEPEFLRDAQLDKHTEWGEKGKGKLDYILLFVRPSESLVPKKEERLPVLSGE